MSDELKEFRDFVQNIPDSAWEDPSFRHDKRSIQNMMHGWKRRGTFKPEQQNPGQKAAMKAAEASSSQRQPDGLMDDRGIHQNKEPTPAKDQPKSFEEAFEKAHEVFMQNVAGNK